MKIIRNRYSLFGCVVIATLYDIGNTHDHQGQNCAMGLTAKQMELRMVCATASTIPGFLGFSPYVDPLGEWQQHMGIVKFEGNPHTEMGEALEDGLARRAAKQLKYGRMER